VTTDPRTLLEVNKTNGGYCHLIPDCIKSPDDPEVALSSKTVWLDRDFDSRVGEMCDHELKQYIAVFYGDVVEGRLAVAGGSKRLRSLLTFSQQKLVIPKPDGGTLEAFQKHALAVKDGQIVVEGFCTEGVDGALAHLSMVNSAFLVLYRLGWQDYSGPAFDQARGFLQKGVSSELTEEDWASIQKLAWLTAAVDPAKVTSAGVGIQEWRTLYDPKFDARDEVLDKFPDKCMSADGDSLVVTLPYSRSLRGKVIFPGAAGMLSCPTAAPAPD
jgi:hypothetical protein